MDATSRQRPLVLLVAVVLAQILLLAFQIKRERDVRLIRVWSVELLTPLESGGTYVMSKISGAWSGYIGLRHEHAENQQLRTELARLELRNQQLEGQAAEAARFARLLGFRQENPSVQMVVAEVIGASADSSSHTIFINRGDHEGLRRNMAVITPDGVVGKISETSPHVAQVLLITDKESGVGALLADTRAHGVVDGTGEPSLQMEFVRGEEKVSLGENIVTSGQDRIFPKDLPLGTVESMKAGLPFQTIQIEPAAHLDRLEEVFVLLTQQPLNLGQSGSTNASATEENLPASQPKPNVAPKSQVSPDGKQPHTKPGDTKLPAPNPAAPAKKPDGGAKPSGGPGRAGGNPQRTAN